MTPPWWVMDTNAVLDWLVFDDPAMHAPAAALREGRAQWACSAAMLEEALEVVGRPQFARRASAEVLRARISHASDAHAHMFETPPASALRCADPDDQIFLDLAAARGASLLLTRDRALLALASQASCLGLRIATPKQLSAGYRTDQARFAVLNDHAISNTPSAIKGKDSNCPIDMPPQR